MSKKITAKISATSGNLANVNVNTRIADEATFGILNFKNSYVPASIADQDNEFGSALAKNSLEQANEKRDFAMENLAITQGSVLLVVAALFIIALIVWICLARQVTNLKNKIRKHRPIQITPRPQVPLYHQNYAPSNYHDQQYYFPPQHNELNRQRTVYSPSNGLPTQIYHYY